MNTLLSREPGEVPAPVASEPNRGRWSASLVASTAIHGAILLVLCWGVAPGFVKLSLLARGAGGTATPVSVTLYMPSDLATAIPVQPPLLSLPSAIQKPQSKKSKLDKRTNILHSDKPPDASEAGSRFGSGLDGPTDGEEVRPGFAISFTDPRVSRWELPGGKQGDVIVELTIDEQGKVVEERLLQGLDYAIDARVIATLREWRFRPATKNGVAIPFKYDAHFHFPS